MANSYSSLETRFKRGQIGWACLVPVQNWASFSYSATLQREGNWAVAHFHHENRTKLSDWPSDTHTLGQVCVNVDFKHLCPKRCLSSCPLGQKVCFDEGECCSTLHVMKCARSASFWPNYYIFAVPCPIPRLAHKTARFWGNALPLLATSN